MIFEFDFINCYDYEKDLAYSEETSKRLNVIVNHYRKNKPEKIGNNVFGKVNTLSFSYDRIGISNKVTIIGTKPEPVVMPTFRKKLSDSIYSLKKIRR